MNKVATFLLCVNFITVLFPQPGYIHPDEFFQSSEIVAGDILDVQHVRVWEFNGTSAVRNIVFPYIIMSPSLYLLKWLNSTDLAEFHLSTVKIVMATRLPIAFLSLLGYLATGRLADCFQVDRYLSTIFYCSSYITWAYYTRTFSNSVESVLLGAVFLLVLTLSGGTAEDSKKKLQSVQAELDDGTKATAGSSPESKDAGLVSPEEDGVEINDGQVVMSDHMSESERNMKKKIKPAEKMAESIEASEKSEASSKMIQKEIKAQLKTIKGSEYIKTKESDAKSKDISDVLSRDKKLSHKALDSETEQKHTEELAELSRLRIEICKLVSFLLGAFVTAGFFNRPTFVAFAFMPVVFWVWNVTKNHKKLDQIPVHIVVFYGSLGSFIIFITFCLLDTLYFNAKFVHIISSVLSNFIEDGYSLRTFETGLKEISSALVITPWNFLKYNSDASNLAKHGIHPRFTHFMVNLSLLLGPLFFPVVFFCATSIIHLKYKSEQSTNTRRLIWLTLMAVVPVLLLSAFPHQEPRFLIPLLPVFVVMGAKVVSAMVVGKMSFFAIWIFFNIILTLVYGYVHQAALIPALSIYQQKLASPSQNSRTYHAIFYKTYPPPRHLLLLPPNSSQVNIHELAGAPLDTLLQTVKHLKSDCQRSKFMCQVHLFVPSTVTPQVIERVGSKFSTTSICPHLSMEAAPRLRAWWKNRLAFEEVVMDFCLNILSLT